MQRKHCAQDQISRKIDIGGFCRPDYRTSDQKGWLILEPNKDT